MRRWYAALAWGVAAIAAAIAGQQTWAHDGVLGVTGADATGGLVTSLAWSAAAIALLLLVLRSLGTRIVGAVAVLVGLGALAAAATSTYPAQGLTAATAAQAVTSPWRWVFASSGLVVALGGVIALLTAAQADRRRPDRYTNPQTSGDLTGGDVAGGGQTEQTGGGQGEPDTRDLWKAMDNGDDPTVDPR